MIQIIKQVLIIYTWCDISCVRDERPSSRFSRSDSLPSPCGCHKTVCSHKEPPPSPNPSALSNQPELSVRDRSFIEPSPQQLRLGSIRLRRLCVGPGWSLTWSASTKMILSTARGNRTSRKRILYPQMIRCFSVCWWSQRGHLYCTNSYWKPYDWAMWEMVSCSEQKQKTEVWTNKQQFFLKHSYLW